jgi:hypothetical protein
MKRAMILMLLLSACGGGGATTGSGGTPGTGGAPASGGSGGAATGGSDATAGGSGGATVDAAFTPDVPPPTDGTPPGFQRLIWRKEPGPTFNRAVGGTGEKDVWSVGEYHEVWHSQGDGKWEKRDPGTDVRLQGIWGTGPDDVYIAPNINYVLHWKGSWVKETTGIPLAVVFHEFWGTGPNDVWAAGGGLMHSTGDGTWTTVRIPVETTGIGAITGFGTDVWGLGLVGNVIHNNGDGKWILEKPGLTSTANDIWAAGPENVYVVGSGEIRHRTNNGVWVQETVDISARGFECIWGSGPNDIFVGGPDGLILRSKGDGKWLAEPIDVFPPYTDVFSIWGTSARNVYLQTRVGVFHGTPP